MTTPQRVGRCPRGKAWRGVGAEASVAPLAIEHLDACVFQRGENGPESGFALEISHRDAPRGDARRPDQ